MDEVRGDKHLNVGEIAITAIDAIARETMLFAAVGFLVGGLDDLLNINLHNFAPSFYQEELNAVAANNLNNQTTNSRGDLRISIYGEYQYTQRFAFFGRVGLDDDFGPPGGGNVAGGANTSSSEFFIRGGFLWTPVDYLDFGISLGFDDLSTSGSFGPQLYLALRI